jgi:uncharacterized protein
VRIKALLFTSLFWLLTLTASAQPTFPKPNGYINDFADILDTNVEQELNTLVHDIESKTTAEIAVATVTSLNGMSVEEYANKMFKEWGIGKKGLDNGILVLIAPNERKMRIEVGYGLEPILPDGLAGEILRTQMTPRFKSNDYAGGIRGGLLQIATVLRVKHIVTPEERKRIAKLQQGPVWILIPFLAMFVGVGGVMFGISVRSKTVLGILIGLFFAGVPTLLGLSVAFWLATFMLIPVAAVTGGLGYRLGSNGSRGDGKWTFGGKGSGTGGSGFWSGSSSSSSSSGGSSSFGGGSSGGGGASGSW